MRLVCITLLLVRLIGDDIAVSHGHLVLWSFLHHGNFIRWVVCCSTVHVHFECFVFVSPRNRSMWSYTVWLAANTCTVFFPGQKNALPYERQRRILWSFTHTIELYCGILNWKGCVPLLTTVGSTGWCNFCSAEMFICIKFACMVFTNFVGNSIVFWYASIRLWLLILSLHMVIKNWDRNVIYRYHVDEFPVYCFVSVDVKVSRPLLFAFVLDIMLRQASQGLPPAIWCQFVYDAVYVLARNAGQTGSKSITLYLSIGISTSGML